MTAVLKEEMNKFFKEIHENTKEINRTVQDLKVEMESIMKTQTKKNLKMKNLLT